MSEEFLFTVPSGEPVAIEPFHYAIVGQTQFSGKTTLIKRLSEWASDLGYKILIFDTKETEADYAGFGVEVPVCLRETTDSFVLIGLLESMFRRRLTHYYATLSRLTERASGFDDIIERAKQMEEKTRSSWLKDACRVLYDLLERLQNETSKVETVPQLQLSSDINRMIINDFSLEAQQLIVKNAFEDALRIYKRNLVLVVDEAFKFIPQGYSSPATRAIMNLMTQGAKTGLFGWISTQFLAVTDKDPLKACAIKFLGTQDHITEVKHTLALIPEVRGKFTANDIMKLKLGHWVLVRKRPPDVRIVYALPHSVPTSLGRKVALGELKPEFVRDRYLKPSRALGDDELVWKKKYEKLRKEFDELCDEVTRLKKDKEKLTRDLNNAKSLLQKVEDDMELLDELRMVMQRVFPNLTRTVEVPETTKTTVNLEHKEFVYNIKHKEETVNVETDTVAGKVLFCVVKDFAEKEFAEADLSKVLVEYGWNIGHSTLAPTLGNLVKDGKLVKIKARPIRYRLPKNVKFKIEKA